MKEIKHNGRLAGWTDKQIDAFYRAFKGGIRGRCIKAAAIHPRVLNTLKWRTVVFEFGDRKIQLTAYGVEVAKSCGWLKNITHDNSQ